MIQLGAFQNTAQAERAWKALSVRFPTVAAMNKLVIPFPGGIRLRAAAGSPAEAKQACQALKAAGENCFVAQNPMQAAIYGLEGLELTDRGTWLLPRRRAGRVHPVSPQLRDSATICFALTDYCAS